MALTSTTNATLADIAQALSRFDNFVICGHVSPDGDCIGSQLALAAALKQLGKHVVCVRAKQEPIESNLLFLPGVDEIIPAADFDGEVGAFVAVDVPTRERIADAASLLDAAPFSFTIDHHASEIAMTDMVYVDPDAPSTTLLIWELAGLLQVSREGALALCAYSGLVSDTGRFQFQNTTARALAVASEMVAAGADPAFVSSALYQNRSLASLRLERCAIERLTLFSQGQVALSFLRAEDFRKSGAEYSDAEPLVDLLRSLSGVRVSCMLREQEGKVRGSLRAKDVLDVSRVAKRFGGGGHKAAAGFTYAGSLDEAIAALQSALEELLAHDSHNNDVLRTTAELSSASEAKRA